LFFSRIFSTLIFLVLTGVQPNAETGRGISAAPDNDTVPFAVGRQYLVVIAVSNYEQWPPLAGPVKDSREIRDILLSRYRIDRLHELYDEQATKANILKLLVRLQEEVKPDDSLLILYAGHGHLDKNSSTGFWIPVNAGTDIYEQQNWLPHTQLRGLLANLQATHVFVISDSCFAGDLILATRSLPDTVNTAFLNNAYSHVCRQVLASGAAEAVPDVSDFAYQLKSALSRNNNPYLDAFTLYNEIRLGVSGSVPLLGSLAGTGHQEGASFLLFLRPDLDLPLEEATPPGAEPGQDKAARPRRDRFSSAVGFGLSFPLASVAGSIDIAPMLIAGAHYNLRRDWGSLGFGLLSGALWLSSNDSIASGYRINSFPLLAELRYQSGGERNPSLSAGLAAGAALSWVSFDDPSLKGIWAAKLMLLPSVDVGVRVFRRFRIVGGGRFPLIFFDNNLYFGISPEIRIEYAF
jgi:hypothetical protein